MDWTTSDTAVRALANWEGVRCWDECGQARPKQASVEFGEEDCNLGAQGCEDIGVRFGNTRHKPFEAQATQVVRHLCAGVLRRRNVHQRGDLLPKGLVGKPSRYVGEVRKSRHNRHHAFVAETQSGSTLAAFAYCGSAQVTYPFQRHETVLAQPFLLQQPIIESTPGLDQRVEMLEPPIAVKVRRVIDHHL